jgi:pyruvate/2-oxoglutarate dehydrogenase complex dihydrolipoamide acyltransferase (E2) component
MADLTLNALRRKMNRAQDAGNVALAERLRKYIAARRGAQDAPPPPAETPAETQAETQAAPPALSFASPEAAELADELGITDFDFEPSGKTGYTKADVQRAAGE